MIAHEGKHNACLIAHEGKQKVYLMIVHEDMQKDYLTIMHEGKQEAYLMIAHEGKQKVYLMIAHEGKQKVYLMIAHEGKQKAYLMIAHEGKQKSYCTKEARLDNVSILCILSKLAELDCVSCWILNALFQQILFYSVEIFSRVSSFSFILLFEIINFTIIK